MDKKAIRARLEALHDDLVALSEASEEARGTVDLDQTKVGRLSRMDALQQQAMDQAIEARRQTDLKRIEAALKRLDGDEYGYCLHCGEEIAAERLELDLATTLCTDCAAEAHP